MEQFTVPQFIERKPKIIGPLIFQQFIFIGIAGAICFILYFTIPFYFFILATVVLMLGSFVLAFGRIGGLYLPETFKNFFLFFLSPKLYLWKKKVGPPPKLIEKMKPAPKEIKETPVLTVVGKSRLKNLSTQIEIKTK